MKLASTCLIVAMLASLITLAPSITGRQKAEAGEKFKLLMEIAHVGFVLYEMAAFGGETAYEQLVPDPSEELLKEVETQGELIDQVQAGLDKIQQNLSDMFAELNLYDSMQNAWNEIPNIQNWYNKLNYDIGDKPHGEVSDEMIQEWSNNVLNSNNIDVAIAQWYTALVKGGVGSNQAPVLTQMRDFALNELNGTSAQSDFSTTVETTNGVGVVAERPMYFDYNGVWTGGSCQAGLVSPAKTFYFAEGTVRPGFNSFICIQNPAAEAAPVRITYMKGDGATAQQNIVVRARSRSTVNVNGFFGALDGPAADFSAKVESLGGTAIIAERPMYFNYNGIWNGGHVNAGVTAPSTSLYFAEGTTRPGFDSFLCLQNPDERDASVAITYMKGDGSNQVQDVIVPAHTRSTVRVSDTIGQYDSPACDFSAKVESINGIGIVAERPMYFAYKGSWTGGHCQNGATTPLPVQYFAEGTTRPNFDSYISIQNPEAAPAPVEITYMLGNGTNKTQSLTVPGKTRSTVIVNDILGQADSTASDFSAKVATTNGAGIIAERPMYFNYNGAWTGGHDAMGATSLAQTFYFAEGTCRPNFDAFFCIQNPNNEDAWVKITFMKGDGTEATQLLAIPKNSRYTQRARDTLGEGDDAAHDFSAKVECFNDMSIAVERPMYFNYKGMWTGGSDVAGITNPNSTFNFAEGSCRPGFEPYFCIQNTTSTDSPVQITYMKGDGTTQLQAVTVRKYSRLTITARDAVGVGDDSAHDFSIHVACTNGQQIIAERPMYFNYKGSWSGGHDVIGVPGPSTQWYFAEGYTGQ